MRYHLKMTLYNDLLPHPLPPEPLELAADWLADAWAAAQQPNPNAMVLATATPAGAPSARVLLCKEIVARPGYVTFFTNYESHKGSEISLNQRVALVMHWDHAHRQVRIEGRAVRAPQTESDEYFALRHWQRRIGAWASAQSRPLERREQLLEAIRDTAARFGTPVPAQENENAGPDYPVPRPPFWGGYHVWADAVELWIEGGSRYHERARWVRTLTPSSGGFTPGAWSATRLQP